MKKKLLMVSTMLLSVLGVRAQCTPVTAPFIENFTANSAPTCWLTYQTTGSGWVFNGNPGYDVSGTQDHTGGVSSSDFAWIDFSVPDAGTCLESPEIDVSGLTAPALRFWHISTVTNASNLNLMGTFNQLFVEAYNGVSWVTVAMEQGENGSNWTEFYYDFTPYIYNTNLIKFRFRGEPTNTTYAYYNDLLLDDVEVFEGSTFCFAPSNGQVLGATANSVTLDWAGTGSNYIVEYGAPGFTPGTGTYVNNTGAPATVSGLTAGNSYDFYVYQNCVTLGDTSTAIGPLSAIAQCSPVTDFYVNTASTGSANVEWVSSGANFIVEYGTTGFNPGSGTSNTVTAQTNQDLNGLTSNSFYDAYVRVICGPGDTSTYFGPVTFNTYGVGQFIDWDVACPTIGFVDISGTGTDLGLGDDTEATFVSPFPILYQGNLVQDIVVGNNGGIILGATSGNVGYGGNFNTLADGYLFIWGDDLDEETGNVYWQAVGTAPNRTLIIHWHNICNFAGAVGDPTVNFQIQIEEATQEIYYVYDDVVFGGTDANDDFGANADIGLSGTQDITISTNNTNFLTNNSCAHFFYTDCPNVENIQITTYDYDQIGLTWNQGLAQEGQWTIVWGLEGFDPATGGLGSMTTSNTFDTITGLTQLTDYDVYVYADCDPTAPLQSSGMLIQHQTAPLCANPFGIGASSAPDSIYASWNWQPNGSGQLPTSYNISYVPSGQSVYGPSATEYNTGSAIFADSIFDPNLIASGIYDVYIQTICNTGDTSIYVGPVNFLAFLDNDSSCYAQELQVNGLPYLLYNNGAQLDPGVSGIAPPATGFNTTDGWGNQNMYRTTWYTFTAPASGDVMISGTDVNFSGKMAVYETTNCGDYNQYNLIGANDNGVLFSSTAAPEWVVCGLTPGQTYYLLHSANFSTQGNFSIRLTEIDFNAGTATGIVDACIGDTVSLFNSIAGYDIEYGNWIDLANTGQFQSDSLFATTVLASQVYNFEYRVQLGCSYDSVIGQVEIYPPSSAGNDGSINVCKNEPINLYSGLTGNVDLGGTWYDPQDNALTSDIPPAGTIPGQFNYDYVAGNGVCPDDTSLVVVIVNPSCDWLGLVENTIEGISLYPNPTQGIVNLVSEGEHEDFDIHVIDVNGRVVFRASDKLNAGTEMKLDLSDLTSGVYLIQLSNQTSKNTLRIVIE
ncbi:Por secretion system C-terminal sorting domain-containing protein [Lishizhenia tianjinensis]|uniref:Por secretion system C-terminal sorting domain-containing protein n=1 Tax=Lishizhenia tianjinensis TaxID=477690 RepID=A0A1I7AWK6_9FLAO|nr:T9SS type A sorting domain-containing protein [Lishizhenia tianjinensis]SFT79327.1 Por secretion system C-terminal sorting domain-containing protein [Lishizhenia tianjinensis]